LNAHAAEWEEIVGYTCNTDMGPGVKGLNYNAYTKNCAACEADCRNLGWCVAYECSNHPATCNIWACQPTSVQEKKGYTCRWKINAPTLTCAKAPVVTHPVPTAPVVKHPVPTAPPVKHTVPPAPVVKHPVPPLFQVKPNSLCRTGIWTSYPSKDGWGVADVDFKIKSDIKDCAACRKHCISLGIAECKAIECSDPKNHCEIWKTTPVKFQAAPRYNCELVIH